MKTLEQNESLLGKNIIITLFVVLVLVLYKYYKYLNVMVVYTANCSIQRNKWRHFGYTPISY